MKKGVPLIRLLRKVHGQIGKLLREQAHITAPGGHQRRARVIVVKPDEQVSLPETRAFAQCDRPCDDAGRDLRAEPDRRPGMNLRKTGIGDVVVPQGDRIGPDVYDALLRLVLLGDRLGHNHVAVDSEGCDQNESDQCRLQ